MIQIRIEDETKALQYLKNQLSEKQLNKASARGINRAIAKANTEYKRKIASQYNIKQADIGKAISLKRATNSKPEGIVSGRRNPLSLSRFNPSFTDGDTVVSLRTVKNKETGKRGLARKAKKANRTTRGIKGVSFQLQKGKTQRLPYAFMTRSKDGSNLGVEKQIFARGKYEGNKFIPQKPQYPIQALKTASPFGWMTKDNVSKHVVKAATDEMQKEFERQVRTLFKI